MRLRHSSILTGLTLATLLLTGAVSAATLEDMRSKEGLTAPAPAARSSIARYDSKYAYHLSAWKKGDAWGVISEQQLQDAEKNARYTPKAKWLAPPEFEQALVARTGKGSMSHVWLKPKGATHWQAFRTDGQKLTALGPTPYTSMRLIREGRDTRGEADRGDPAKDRREAYRELVLGIHESGDPASATVDLIDAVDNRVLLEISQLNLGEEPRDEYTALVFQHDAAAAHGYSVIKLSNPWTDRRARWLNTPPEELGFYREITFDPVVHALDVTGKPVILDRDFRPFSMPGLTLGKPEPLRQGDNIKTQGFRRVPVTTASGQAGYQLIYRNKAGNPELYANTFNKTAPALWSEIFEDSQGMLIGKTPENQWRLLYWTLVDSTFSFYSHSFDLAGTRLVTGASLDALYVSIAAWERSQAEHKRRHEQETREWLAKEPERARLRAAEEQRQRKEYEKAVRETALENQRRNEQAAAAFAARNKSSWGNLSPLTLPSLQGASGLSTMEKDYYDNRGNARNPYVIRERK